MGNILNLEKENALFDLQQQVDDIIQLATDAGGRINRTELCSIACERAGRKSPKAKGETEEKGLSDDRLRDLFLTEWLPQAVEEHARCELFKQREREIDKEQ